MLVVVTRVSVGERHTGLRDGRRARSKIFTAVPAAQPAACGLSRRLALQFHKPTQTYANLTLSTSSMRARLTTLAHGGKKCSYRGRGRASNALSGDFSNFGRRREDTPISTSKHDTLTLSRTPSSAYLAHLRSV